MKEQFERALAPAYLALCLVLGGSSSGGVWANAFLQLLGIAVIVGVLVFRRPAAMVRTERHLLLLGSGIAVIGLCQLVPLPAALWAHAGGRASVAQGFGLLGAPAPWLPLSLWPAATLDTMVSLIPPAAMVLLVVRGGADAIRPLAWTLILVAAASFALGFAQIIGSDTSPLYFYTLTNAGQSVGFFANSNHLATLGVMTLPFLAAIAARSGTSRQETASAAGKWALMACLAALIVFGIIVDRSFAGIGLLVPSMIGSFLIFRAERARVAVPVIAGVIVAVVAVFVTIAYLSPVVNGFAFGDLSIGAHGRAGFARHTLAAVATFLPFGSGLGSFIQLYPQFDNGGISDAYVNHAHNDWLEFALEAGLPGMALLAAFLVWWGRQAFFAWRDGGVRARFARAASVASALVMFHSLVDYPLRTAAIGTLFALCCALVARPLSTVTPQLFADTSAAKRGRMLTADD